MGTWYIPFAFATAAAADPDAKLYYNDYNIEYAGSKASAAVSLIEMVQAYGAKIDGVGLQGHFIVGSTPSESSLLAQINTYAAMGLEVAYTELDVRFSSLPPTTAGLAQQATDYGSVTSACLASKSCVGITVWYVPYPHLITVASPPPPQGLSQPPPIQGPRFSLLTCERVLPPLLPGTLTTRTPGSPAPSRARATRACTGRT